MISFLKVRTTGVLMAIAGAALVSAGGSASAAVIYQDSFSRGSVETPLALNGTSPDLVNTPAATWTAGPTNTTNGATALNKSGESALLPLVPASGSVYTLSAD